MERSDKILIIEPDELFLLRITEFLQKEGYDCTPVHNGPEALAALETKEFDLLLATIQMPDNEELELVEAARLHSPNMPVILYTGYPLMRTALSSIQLHVTTYLLKPFEFSLLLHQIRVSIADYQLLKEKEATLMRAVGFAMAIEDTIKVLTDTRKSFKSNQLAALRRRLERVLDNDHPGLE